VLGTGVGDRRSGRAARGGQLQPEASMHGWAARGRTRQGRPGR
jgi:hypothetical protein